MDNSDERSLTRAKAQSISTAGASLAGRGLRDLQKIQEWELVFPEDRIAGWIKVNDRDISAQGIVKVPKGFPVHFIPESNESDLSFLSGIPSDFPLYEFGSFGNRITDVGFASISRLKQLQTLNLSLSMQMTDDGLAHISGLQNLGSYRQIREAVGVAFWQNGLTLRRFP